MTGQVSLVGAGCGPADWITVAGQKALQSCDVLLYDELIDPSLPRPMRNTRVPSSFASWARFSGRVSAAVWAVMI